MNCPGGSNVDYDPLYPHEDGSIGVWGFGVIDGEVRDPAIYFDYMTYCDPTWVSDWQWSATFQRIETLSSWNDSAEANASSMLVGTVDLATDTSRWWTAEGRVEPGDLAASSATISFVRGTQELGRVSADVDRWTEGTWATVRANLPEDIIVSQTEALVLRAGGSSHRVSFGRVKAY